MMHMKPQGSCEENGLWQYVRSWTDYSPRSLIQLCTEFCFRSLRFPASSNGIDTNFLSIGHDRQHDMSVCIADRWAFVGHQWLWEALPGSLGFRLQIRKKPSGRCLLNLGLLILLPNCVSYHVVHQSRRFFTTCPGKKEHHWHRPTYQMKCIIRTT